MEFCSGGDLHILRQRQPGKHFSEQAARLTFWQNARSGQPTTSHDAGDVERGILELRKLSIEQQLWEASRREIDHSSLAPGANHKRTDSELSS
uniref:Uncharacterized protein n=1 Tax=Salix viminalis TaxID=40686 RepID=A0A6N2LR85_SALVM